MAPLVEISRAFYFDEYHKFKEELDRIKVDLNKYMFQLIHLSSMSFMDDTLFWFFLNPV